MKKLLSLLVTVSMVMGFVIPVYAEGDVRIDTILDEDMSAIGTSMIIGATELAASTEYAEGDVWGVADPVASILRFDENGMTIKTKDLAQRDIRDIYKKAFIKNPAEPESNVRLTYEIKTHNYVGGTPSKVGDYNAVRIFGLLNERTSTSGGLLFGYEPWTGNISFAGTHYENFDAPAYTTNLNANSDYTIVIDLEYNGGSGYYNLLGSVFEAGVDAAIYTVRVNDYTRLGTDSADFESVGFTVRAARPQNEDHDILTIKSVKVDNIVSTVEEVVYPEPAPHNGAHLADILNDDMGTITQHDVLLKGPGGGANLEIHTLYLSGEYWGSPWGMNQNNVDPILKFDNKRGMTINTAQRPSGMNDMYKKVFAKSPAHERTNIRLSYQLTTHEFVDEDFQVWALVDKRDGGGRLFCYNASTGVVSFAGTQGGLFSPTNENDFATLAENANYTIVIDLEYNEVTFSYDLAAVILNEDGSVLHTSEVENYAQIGKDSANFQSVGFTVFARAAQPAAEDVLTIKAFNVENWTTRPIVEFGDIQYAPENIVLKQEMKDLDLNGVVALENEEYTNGSKWGKSKDLSDNYRIADDYLWATTGTTKLGYNNTDNIKGLSKKFTPVGDGEKLTLTSVIKFNDISNITSMASLRLVGGDHDLTLLRHRYHSDTGGLQISALGLKSPWNFTTINDIPLAKGALASLGLSGDVTLELTMSPNSDGANYDVNLTLTGTGAPLTANLSISKEIALGFDTFEIMTAGHWPESLSNILAVKDLEIKTKAAETGLAAGLNTLYIPYENISGIDFGAELIAAVCSGDTQKDYEIKKYDVVTGHQGSLEVDVDITDATKEYVRVFIFEDLDNIRPLTMPKSTKTGQ